MFKKIVWATDGSKNADRALTVAKSLAAEQGAALTIVHVVQRIASGKAKGFNLVRRRGRGRGESEEAGS